MEMLITFDSTASAIEGEAVLLESGIDVKVMNLPSSIKAGCGISLRVPPDELAKAVDVLKHNGCTHGGIYKRTISGAKSQYEAMGKEDNNA